MAFVPNTGSRVDRGIGTETTEGRTTTGLSTQIVIKVNEIPVGALQNLTVTQTRGLQRVNEIGTDGNIEIVPNAATTFDLSATRIVFDQLRLPEAFSRSFRFINAQRIPFDIEIYDIGNLTGDPTAVTVDSSASGITVMKFVNCWFNRYETPYTADNYIISETATIWAETGYVSVGTTPFTGIRNISSETDSFSVEQSVNTGKRRGAVDAAGLIEAVFA